MSISSRVALVVTTMKSSESDLLVHRQEGPTKSRTRCFAWAKFPQLLLKVELSVFLEEFSNLAASVRKSLSIKESKEIFFLSPLEPRDNHINHGKVLTATKSIGHSVSHVLDHSTRCSNTAIFCLV